MHHITRFIINILHHILKKSKSIASQNIYKAIVQRLYFHENQIYRLVQQVSFAAEIKALQVRQALPKKSKLCSLHPFIDGFGILRVGGRLQNTYLS